MTSNMPQVARLNRTAFQRALDEYFESLPQKKRKREFIVSCQLGRDGGSSPTVEAVKEAMRRVEEKKSSKRIFRKLLDPLITVLVTYHGIIEVLASSDPTPCSIIWGALKIVLDGAHRYSELFQVINDELRRLTVHLQQITSCEELYPHSETLQDLLCSSYIHVLRFWSRVDKECNRCSYSTFLKSITTFSTTKLNEILQDMHRDADQIEKLAFFVEARLEKGEREDAEAERVAAGMERKSQVKERVEAREWRETQRADRPIEIYRQIKTWLLASDSANASQEIQRRYINMRTEGTCGWLLDRVEWKKWTAGDGTDTNSILWVQGGPGCGKSILCSYAIRSITEMQPCAAVAFHYYQFDREYSSSETLRGLVDAIFETFSTSHAFKKEIYDVLYTNIQRSPSRDENIVRFLEVLLAAFERVYIFIDGLDEECTGNSQRLENVRVTIDIMLALARKFPGSLRLWFSSQDRAIFRDKFSEVPTICAPEEIASDVHFFLSSHLGSHKSEDIPSEVLQSKVDYLKSRAEGNFLWASLMIRTITEEATNVHEIQILIESEPRNLNEYYQRIIDRVEPSHRHLASLMFALITFARRPLRIKELQEAIGMLRSTNPEVLDANALPFIRLIGKLLSPLVQLQNNDEKDPLNFTCRLFHFTVYQFFERHPEAFNVGSVGMNSFSRVSPSVICNACLLYLSQTRYRSLLRRETIGDLRQWADGSGDPVSSHHFLLYAAKYWCQHLKFLRQVDSGPEKTLLNRVRRFLTSRNFQTCIQVQALWVDGQFALFSKPHENVGSQSSTIYLRQSFPTGIFFAKHKQYDQLSDLAKEYQTFLYQWRHFLDCQTCGKSDCPMWLNRGEIDRCFWNGSRKKGIMGDHQCRYSYFNLERVPYNLRRQPMMSVEAVSEDGRVIKLLHLLSKTSGVLNFEYQRWSVMDDGSEPVHDSTQDFSFEEEDVHWASYIHYTRNNTRAGRPDPIAFSPDLGFLRIGSLILAEDSKHQYSSAFGSLKDLSHLPTYIEEFCIRDSIVVLAARQSYDPAICEMGLRDIHVDHFGRSMLLAERCDMIAQQRTNANSNDSSSSLDVLEETLDTCSSCSSSPTDRSISNRAYESWSEASSQSDQSIFDEFATPWTETLVPFPDASDDESVVSAKVDEEPGSDGSSEAALWLVDSDDKWDPVTGQYEDVYDGDRIRPRDPGRHQKLIALQRQREYTASLAVYSTKSRVPVKLFVYTAIISSLLYGSPPIVHSVHSLVIWPVGDGKILFGDFEEKTFYTRTLWPSTPHTRYIFMKCRFSPDGKFLHVASLEAQRNPFLKKEPLHLSLLLFTYRLSKTHPERRAPTLVHRTRVTLGTARHLSVSKLPFTLTWTPTELYFTRSDCKLDVYRVSLFRSPPESISEGPHSEVLVPGKTIFLPASDHIQSRDVFFFPPLGHRIDSLVILGSEPLQRHTIGKSHERKGFNQASGGIAGSQRRLLTVTGCYLNDCDLGEWKGSKETTQISEESSTGKLDETTEWFNYYEDVNDLELYLC